MKHPVEEELREVLKQKNHIDCLLLIGIDH